MHNTLNSKLFEDPTIFPFMFHIIKENKFDMKLLLPLDYEFPLKSILENESEEYKSYLA